MLALFRSVILWRTCNLATHKFLFLFYTCCLHASRFFVVWWMVLSRFFCIWFAAKTRPWWNWALATTKLAVLALQPSGLLSCTFSRFNQIFVCFVFIHFVCNLCTPPVIFCIFLWVALSTVCCVSDLQRKQNVADAVSPRQPDWWCWRCFDQPRPGVRTITPLKKMSILIVVHFLCSICARHSVYSWIDTRGGISKVCLCLLFSQNNSLKELWICSTQIGDAGATSIGNALAYVQKTPRYPNSYILIIHIPCAIWTHRPMFYRIDHWHYHGVFLFDFAA